MEPRRLLLEVFQHALRAVDGAARVRDYLALRPLNGPIYLIAIGKAACAMARGAHEALNDRIQDAFIVTKEGHTESLPWAVRETGHPIPDERSLQAGDALDRFVSALPSTAHVLVLLSGGASALIEKLPAEVDVAQWRQINEWLLASGFDIKNMNRIRKRLSLIKGGRLAQRLAPRPVTCLMISDVPGDDPKTIGSGPLLADPELQRVFDAELPDFIAAPLKQAPPAPAAGDKCFANVRVDIVARLDDAKSAAAQAAVVQGLRTQVDADLVAGDAAEAGSRLASYFLHSPAGVLHIWGGETTVRLPLQPGRGGRNQTLALAAALELDGAEDVYFLSAGTDGTDGPTQDAGALVDGGSIARGTTQGLDAADALKRADAGTFLEASGDLIHTGPTGTNVMDLMLGLRLSRTSRT